MKSNLLTLTLGMAILLSSAVLANTSSGPVPPARALKVALDLSEEQLMALRELVETRAMDVKASNAGIDELKAELDELVKSESPDSAEIGGLVLDIRVLKEEIREGHEAYQQAFRDLLTEEQLERLGNINRIAVAERAADALHKLKLR